jgi:hypothetical protein
MWEGWVEFIPLDGKPAIRSGRETTQPNRIDTQYWATGLGTVYLEGALQRALKPLAMHTPPHLDTAREASRLSAASTALPQHDAVLNPFSVYEKGEPLLRRQLAAFSPWHLVNIIDAYRLSDETPAVLARRPAAELIETIVSGVSAERPRR